MERKWPGFSVKNTEIHSIKSYGKKPLPNKTEKFPTLIEEANIIKI